MVERTADQVRDLLPGSAGGIPLPERFLAARPVTWSDAGAVATHLGGFWLGGEEIREVTFYAPWSELTISLLLYLNDAPYRRWGDDLNEPREWALTISSSLALN